MTIYFITGNTGKFEEIHSLIPHLQQKDIDLPELQEIDPHAIIQAKLTEAFKHVQADLIVEDTSLYMDCLHGLPGPLIKWFLKTLGTTGLAHIAQQLKNNTAHAKTLIGYAKNTEDVHFFEGVIQGTIVSPRGNRGFGWDSIFQPDGFSKTFAEMTQNEKQEVSMRKIATLKLKKFLNL